MTSMTYFTPFSSVSIVDFGQLNVSWVMVIHTLESYADCLMTSGAIQNGVPTNVCRLFIVFVNCPATPKSASFTAPCSDSKTLAAI